MSIALTTLARLKESHLPLGADTTQDAYLTRLINAYSAEFETYLGMPTQEVAAILEEHEVEPGDRLLTLNAWPVTQVTEVKYAYMSQAASWADIDPVSTSLWRALLPTGQVRLLFQTTIVGGVARVKYDGGMALDTASFIVAFPRIAEACDQQIAYHYSRRDAQGGNKTVAGGSTSFTGPLALLDSVRETLSYYRRRRLR